MDNRIDAQHERQDDAASEDVVDDVLTAARAYTRRGWRVVPLPYRAKAPVLKQWDALRLSEEDLPRRFPSWQRMNVGLLLGEPSGGLVDVDCDVPEAVVAARELFPPTGMVSGRAGNPASHYWYVVEDELPRSFQCSYAEAAHETMYVELRSTGGQTVVPPSVHPSGERLRWERTGEPGHVSRMALAGAVGSVGAAVLLARHWPGEGTRDAAALALCGFLLRRQRQYGWDAARVDAFARLVARLAGDEEWRQRGKAEGAAERLAKGEHVMGLPSLASLLVDGPAVVAKLVKWLGEEEGRAEGVQSPTTSLEARDSHSQGMTFLGEDDVLGSIAFSEVAEGKVRWLWQGRIPLGALTLMDGDPGLGKSLITLDLAARVTTGREMPDGTPGANGGVVLLSAEDDHSTTIRPRLLAAGANLDRVHAIGTVRMWDAERKRWREREFSIPHDVELLEPIVRRHDVRLIVVDPLMAYLDGKFNSWRDQDVRTALSPLARLAERTGAAILILRHLNKSSGANAVYRGGGSIGIIGAARSGLLVAKHPDDPDHERVLATSKSNLGPPMTSLRYRLRAISPEAMPCIEWLGECEQSASALLSQMNQSGDEPAPSAIEEAAQFLREILRDGPRRGTEVKRQARASGISLVTLDRARKVAHVDTQHIGLRTGAYWAWVLLPDDNNPDDSTPDGTPSENAPKIVNTAQECHAITMTVLGGDDDVGRPQHETDALATDDAVVAALQQRGFTLADVQPTPGEGEQ